MLAILNTVAFLLCPKLSRKLQSIVLESGLATSPQIELLGEKWLCLVLCTGYPLQMAVLPELVPIYRFCSASSTCSTAGYCCVVRYHGVWWTCLLTHRQLYAPGLGNLQHC